MEDSCPLSAGECYSLFLDGDQNVWVTGKVNHKDYHFPHLLTDLPPIVKIAGSTIGGGFFALLLDGDGHVWGIGNNNNWGQLALGEESMLDPQLINTTGTIDSIACGGKHSVIIDREKNIWVSGNNSRGQFGIGSTTGSSEFLPVELNFSARYLVCGLNITMVLDTTGILWAAGCNTFGQLGIGEISGRVRAFRALSFLPSIKYVSVFERHTLILDTDGGVWASGWNLFGQLGLGHTTNRNRAELIQKLPEIRYISAGYCHSLMVDCEGRVWAAGHNYYGQLGLGTNSEIGVVVPTLIPNIPPIRTAVAAGWHSLLEDTEGKVWVMGLNKNGRLGLGDTDDRHQPVTVGIPSVAKARRFLTTKRARG